MRRTLTLAACFGLACGTKPAAQTEETQTPGHHDSGWLSDTGGCSAHPIVNYNNFGEGFILHYCQGCHASTTPNRYGAPEEVTFDTVEQVWTWQERILERAAVEPPTMPPAGATNVDDRTRLRWWLECAEEGT